MQVRREEFELEKAKRDYELEMAKRELALEEQSFDLANCRKRSAREVAGRPLFQRAELYERTCTCAYIGEPNRSTADASHRQRQCRPRCSGARGSIAYILARQIHIGIPIGIGT